MSHYEDRHLDFVLKHWQPGRFDTKKAIDRFKRSHVEKRKPRLRWLPATAAAAVLVVGLFCLREHTSWTELSAGSVAQAWNLPDGTEVTLSSGSRLSYRNRKSSREVRLEGKAFFDVVRDETKPFGIEVEGGFVKVLGTEFLVDGTKEGVMVYVQSGKVLFSRSDRSDGIVLTDGMSAVLAKGESIPEFDEVPQVNSLAWNRGTFVFDQTPLKQVLDELGAYYGASFAATDLDRRLSGEFAVDDLDLILELIESALDVTIIRKK